MNIFQMIKLFLLKRQFKKTLMENAKKQKEKELGSKIGEGILSEIVKKKKSKSTKKRKG